MKHTLVLDAYVRVQVDLPGEWEDLTEAQQEAAAEEAVSQVNIQPSENVYIALMDAFGVEDAHGNEVQEVE